MTAKRFTINNDRDFKNIVETYELNCINDNDNETFYFIADSIENVQLFIKRLNELHEENQDLKAFNQDLSEELSVCANARISKDNRIKRLEEKIQRERNSFRKTQERWSKEAEDKIKELSEENEQLKFQLQNTSIQRDEFHRGARENANRVGELKKENEQLKAQLLYDGDDVCGICKHEYLVPSGDYFIGKCKKGHKECSKEDIKYCENFELRQVDFDDLIRRMDKELYK